MDMKKEFINKNYDIRKFDLVINKLSKVFIKILIKDTILNYDDYSNKGIFNKFNTIQISYKNYLGFKLLENFISDEDILNKNSIPKLDYNSNKEHRDLNKGCNYSINLIKPILDILSSVEKLKNEKMSGFNLCLSEDTPIKIETKEFLIYIAPRGEDY
jgi:hypothetical protein